MFVSQVSEKNHYTVTTLLDVQDLILNNTDKGYTENLVSAVCWKIYNGPVLMPHML